MNRPNFGNDAAGVQIAFISTGKLFYKPGSSELRQVHSPYIQEMMDRMEKSRNLHSWKENTSFGIAAGGRGRQFGKDEVQISVTSVQIDPSGTLFYFLKDDGVGGLFSYDPASGAERRLLHRQHLDLSDLNFNPANGKLLCSSRSRSGIANIAMLDREGDQYRELTGGDTLDSAPTWVPGEDKRLLFQSIGLARNEHGHVVAQANASIQLLDMQSGEISPVAEDPRYDFLQPKVCPKGDLHFIRRPYEPPGYGIGYFLKDTLFFPFRLLRAVFHFLNFFSLMYTRKPLTSASGPAIQADLKSILLKGKRIDAEKALRKEAKVGGVPSLVPKSWQLVRRAKDGTEKILATNVASYDILPNGNIICSNGRGVFLLDEGAPPRLILQGELVGDLAAAPMA